MAEPVVTAVTAWEALDSRGTPTLGCTVRLSGGARGRAVVPSGASTGSHDARELRGGSWDGLGVTGSVRLLRERIGPALAGRPPAEVDTALDELDPSPDLREIGVHAALGVSIAARRAAADAAGVPLHALLSGGRPPLLPMPMVNVVSGGAHAAGATDIQDVLVVPVGAGSFREAIEWAWRVRRRAAELAAERGAPAALVADEGGLAVPGSAAAAIELVVRAIERAGLAPGEQVALAVDVAANQLWDGEAYLLDRQRLDAGGMVAEIAGWCRRYPLVSVEDPVHDRDWAGWAQASSTLRTQLVGDDLFATSADRIAEAARRGVANAVLLKPNQRGTLSRAEAALASARAVAYATVVSARSGDTEDDWLADLAVGWRAGQIKVGSTTRSERTAKWNRLLEIEAEAGPDAELARPGSTNGMRGA